MKRRQMLKLGALAAASLAAPRRTGAQAPQLPVPPSTITTPARDFGPGAPPTTYFMDPDIVVVDPQFGSLVQANTPIKRLWTGALWCEGPAWSGQSSPSSS